MMPLVNVSKIQVHHFHFLNYQTGAVMYNRIMQKLNTPRYLVLKYSELASNSFCSRQLKTLITFLKIELSRTFSFSAVSKCSSIKMWLSMTVLLNYHLP